METVVVLAVLLGAGRLLVGTALLLAPERAGGAWLGDAVKTGAMPVAIRALGIRDAAIGGGLVLAAFMDDPIRLWLIAGALSDGVDMLASAAAGDRLERRARLGTVIIAGFATAANLALVFLVHA